MRHRAAQGTLGRTAVGVLAWSLGAGCAVAVGALALSLIGSGLGERSRPPLAAMADPAPTPSGSPLPSASPSPAGSTRPSPSRSAVRASPSPSTVPVQRDFTFDAGSVTAQCSGDLAYLVSWSPAQGYRAKDVHRGPATAVTVEFESYVTEARVWVRCVSGVPRASITHERRR